VPAGQNGDQGFLDDAGLTENDTADSVSGGGDVAPQLIYGVDKRVRIV
jgi:hypothetical protein